MSRKTLTLASAISLTILLVLSLALTFYFAQLVSLDAIISCIIGVVLSLAFAPIFHELGHIVVADLVKMQIVYAKLFCVKLLRKRGKLRVRFASPFTADETQAVPKTSGNIYKRARAYTLGGLLFGGGFVVLLVVLSIAFALVNAPNFLYLGMLPYSVYLFIFNALPLEYAVGKTDALIYKNLKKGEPAEKNMLCAMEIQGLLFEGKSFAEIDESLYFNVPQLSEEEPLFAVMLDLRYRYYLEKGDMEKAGDCLNRLIDSQEYLPLEELQKVAGECVYMYSLIGDLVRAEESGKIAKPYLSGDSASAKRILATFTATFGDKTTAKILQKQAQTALSYEHNQGVKKFESILLSRIELE